ncbi:hypothetical protein [Allobaculum mucilyticum]|uniref:hypothetical protein n=2 Tax=Allobaculum mucilyticum TaxID=2834459 RepID=UPI001E4E3652|nr:hypothetical protein [Allobaculum mucilyticum]
MSDRLRSVRQSMSETRKVEEGKSIELEKGDFAALCAAAWSTLGRTAILTMGFFVLVAAVLILLWML